MATSCWSISADARQLRRAYSCSTTAWDWLPSGSSTSPTAIRRGFALSPTTPSTGPTKAVARRSTSLDEFAGSRARCDHSSIPLHLHPAFGLAFGGHRLARLELTVEDSAYG